MKKLLILGITAVVLTACTEVNVPFLSSTKTESSSSSSAPVFASLKEQLNGREFVIVTEGYNKKTSIGFQGDRVYGFSGINRYFGNYQISGGKFVFDDFGLTQMAGSEEEMTKELQFLDLLRKNKSIKLSGDTLTLISTEGIELVFKKKEKTIVTIYSPMNGKVIELKEVPDEAFAQKMVGDGCAIEPDRGIICSPIDGQLMNIFPTNHAIIFETIDGLEMIVHFGIDTVKLDGKGFQKLREPGPIKIGDEIVKYNLDDIKDGVPSTRSPIIINNMEKVEKIEVLSLGKLVKIGEPIMKVTLK